jgi:hypothetical protein
MIWKIKVNNLFFQFFVNNQIRTMYKILLFLSCLAMVTIPLKAGNHDDTPVETRPFQLSIFPFIGTEGVYSQNNIYNFSINLFAGTTGGVDGIELGGFVNMNRYTMKGFQVAGFGNLVNGAVEGFNVNGSTAQGFQGAGFVNIVNDDAKLFQGAGFTNIVNGNFQGVQGAGFANITGGNSESVQLSGFANVTGGTHKGIQVSGFANVAGRVEGIQVASFANIAGGRFSGIQVSGFASIANHLEGIQAAGFVNVARKVNGIQLGFINVADTIDGLPVGFISIVRDGYRKLEFSGSDAMNLNVAFKIGVRRLYNLFTLGSQFTSDNTVFSYGYGIGTEFYLENSRYINVELVSHQLMQDRWWRFDRIDILNQLRASYAFDLNDRWQFFAGPVINVHVISKEDNDSRSIAPYSLLNIDRGTKEAVVWAGVNAGFRFW